MHKRSGILGKGVQQPSSSLRTSFPLSRGPKHRQRGSSSRTNKLVLFLLASFLLIGTILINVSVLTKDHSIRKKEIQTVPLKPSSQRQLQPLNKTTTITTVSNNPSRHKSYAGWKEFAIKLAALPAQQVLETLERDDPFGVRQFEEALLKEEAQEEHVLDLARIESLFACPPSSERISVPDQRDLNKARDFKQGKNFLFFQHLRKAGGTNFCSLAEKNLKRREYPNYYCMPDYAWSNHTKAGYLHHWNNDQIISNMKKSGHRVAGNEWDNFDVLHHFDLPAVFATSFRRPLDRALSQFRFECIEDRGCKIKNVTKWWERRPDLINVYTGTFSDARKPGLKRLYEHPEPSEKRGQLMSLALDTVAKFHLVLAMEWLGYAGPLVENVIGFKDLSPLTHRVRPHIGQAKRNDGQEENKLGAAGIAKASWVGKEYLDPKQYKIMTEHLAMDEILTDAARRMFLERLVCHDRI